MRITGGTCASRPLKGPSRGMPLRPTPDALRERVFAVLGEHTAGARVLDLFAGTGAIGLEALSRGARHVVFVDHHKAATRLILANCSSLAIQPEGFKVITRPARAAVSWLARRAEPFDLIWADPPFDSWQLGLEALDLAAGLGLTAKGARVCLECPASANLTEALDSGGRLEQVRTLECGASKVALLGPRG